ncbi:hypothetical protein [Deinococcus sp. Marseille-Q6407]|uniref:hypothetical protein n=1 Tax=Deinococcus sp. Marseille-Q6407 TaxID=2969223 RepID=UPI0021BE6821|nr:hypothetical protein [Deinococcus sp. Marseille-Q6407]
MPLGPYEMILIAVLLGLPVLATAALVLLLLRARKTDSPAEQARIRELEDRIQELEQAQKRRR